MSLLTYEDAVPWGEAIREQLVTETMPPWYASAAGPAVKGGYPISAKELDILVTWASGGTPEGDQPTPAARPYPNHWRAGQPDLVLEMPAAHVMPPGVIDGTQEILLPTGLTGERWIKMADLKPGTPSMVRDATIALEDGLVLCAWVAGHQPISTPNSTGFFLPAGARLRLTIHYKKNWKDEQIAKSDQSAVGLYFMDPPLSGRSIRQLNIDGARTEAPGVDVHTWSATLDYNASIVAVRPSVDRAYGDMQIDAVLPAGQRIPILRLHAVQPKWTQRYWLVDPIEVPTGTKVSITVSLPAPHDTFTPASRREPLRVALDLTPS
jgi:hypothetical protein